MRRLFLIVAAFSVSAVAQTSGPGSQEFCWHHSGPGITDPVATYKPAPQYSEEARKAKLEGSVLVSVVVGQDGKPINAKVLRPLGLGLDERALEAVVAHWRFNPGMKDGKPVAVQTQLEIPFRLPER
jgi:periplasmic protein TonB